MLPAFTLARYRRLWWVTVLSICVPALALTLCVSPVPCLAVGGIGTWVVYVTSFVRSDWFGRQQWHATAAGPVLLAAAVPVLGWAAPPLMVLAAASSPPVVRHVIRPSGAVHGRWIAHGSHDTGVGAATEVAECLETMSAVELCRLWGTSFALVKSSGRLSERVMGAGLRLSLLDELERRDSDGFTSWLARHPSPASEPRWVLGRVRPDDEQSPRPDESVPPAADA